VQWSPSLIAFLYYYFVVITYWLPGADYAMVIAVASLVFRIHEIRVGRILSISAVWIGWAWIAYLASPKQSLAFEQTWILTKLWVVTFVAFNVLRTQAQIRFFLAFATACFVLFPMRGTMVNFLIGENAGGRAIWNYTYNNPNDLAAFALMFSSIALALIVVSKNRFSRLLAALSAGGMVVLIFFTQSRGALLATAVIGLVLAISKVRNIRVLVGVTLAIATAAYLAPASVWTRLGGLEKISMEGGMRGVDREGSAEQRFQIAQIAARVAMDHPIAGVGAGTYQEFHADYSRGLQGEFPLAGGKKDAHNTYLHSAAELGFVGLAIFLAMTGTAVFIGIRANRRTPRGGEAIQFLTFGLIGYLLAGIFGSLEYINVLHLHLVLIEAVSIALVVTPVAHPRRTPLRSSPRTIGQIRPVTLPQ
jgi:O-antigen ligase